jgi:hypothetical protein
MEDYGEVLDILLQLQWLATNLEKITNKEIYSKDVRLRFGRLFI